MNGAVETPPVKAILVSTAALPAPGFTAPDAEVPFPAAFAHVRTWKNELAPLFSLNTILVPSSDSATYELMLPGPMSYANITFGAVPPHRPVPAEVLYRLFRPIKFARVADPAISTPVTTKSVTQLGTALTSNTYLAGVPMVPPLPPLSEKLQSRSAFWRAQGSNTWSRLNGTCKWACRRRYCCRNRGSLSTAAY